MSRTFVGSGNVVSGQVEVFSAPPAAYASPGTVPGVIYCHGATKVAYNITEPLLNFGEYAIYDALRQKYCVAVGDFEFTNWGNDQTIADVEAMRVWMQTTMGAKAGKIALVGASMGATVALNYTLAHPANVACVAANIPAVDARSNPGFAASLNSAYPPTFNDAVVGPTHIPVEYAASFPNIPVHLWYSTADTVAYASAVQAFAAACPTATATITSTTGDHNQTTIAATPIGNILAFIAANLS